MSVAIEDPPLEPFVLEPARGESLAASVIVLLVMTVAQRLIGFGRGIMFCRWLDPEQLGEWDVAFGFLNLVAPLAVLGLPGAFGRYVEHFRHRGQFHTFLKRTVCVCAGLSAVVTAVIIVQRDWFSQLIFGSEAERGVVVWLAVCLLAIIVHNFLTCLFIAVRRYRIVTMLQFVQGLGFAILSLALLAVWPPRVTSVIIAFGLATLISIIGSVTSLRELAADEPRAPARISQSAFWSKLLPFAVWMWVTNLLANVFDLIDRYMIVHHGAMDVDEALRQVGYYHSSRIVPLFFVAVASMLGVMITPHLTHDWELGRREAVVRRLNMVLKLVLGALLACSVATLFLAPFLFNVAFKQKFEGGLVVLPWTLMYCAWLGAWAVAQNYLWCAERPGLGSVALFAGLLLNIGVNLLLLPRYGLEGAVWATTLANLAALVLTYLLSRWHGMYVDLGTWILSLAPLSLGLGAWFALMVLVFLVAASLLSDRVLLPAEKQHLLAALAHPLERLNSLRRRLAGDAANA